MFKVYLDGIEVNGVTGFDDFEEQIERDPDVSGLFISYPLELTFSDDGYRYIINKLNTGGFCQTITVLVQEKCGGAYQDTLNGLLFLSDIRRNETECTLRVKIADNNYGAKIKNNKNVKAKLNVAFSKNGVAITPCPVTQVLMFAPNTGSSTTIRYCYDVVDAFEYLVSFMTDGTVGFVSDYLDTLTIESQLATVQRLVLVTGLELRVEAHTDVPDISFRELFDEINKKNHIAFKIELDSSGNPIMRIEEDISFYKPETSFTADKIPLLESSFDPELLYSSINIGSSNTATYDIAKHSLPPIRFLGFKEEQYAVQGTCNIDKELDLVSDFIIDHNIIEELVDSNTSNASYDEDVFIIQAQFQSGGYRATQGFYITDPGSPPALYNEILTNKEVAPRWEVQGNIAKYLGDGSDNFLAERTTVGPFISHIALATNTLTPFPFDNDSTPPNNDPNNRYNNTLYKYTSPANGVYGFEIGIIIETFGLLTVSLYKWTAEKYDATNVLIESITPGNTMLLYGVNTYSGDFTFYLNQNEYIIIKSQVTAQNTNFRYLNGSTFECVNSNNGGGIYEPKDPDAYFVRKYSFEYPISRDEFDLIKADPSKAWNIGMNPNSTHLAWISKVSRKSRGGLTKCEMITSNNNL